MNSDRQTPVTSRASSTPSLVSKPVKMTDAPAASASKSRTAGAVKAGVTPNVKDQYAFLEATKPTKEIKRWSKEQDSLLTAAVKEFGEKNWKAIADRVPQRTDSQCLHRWTKVLNPWYVLRRREAALFSRPFFLFLYIQDTVFCLVAAVTFVVLIFHNSDLFTALPLRKPRDPEPYIALFSTLQPQ